MKKLLLILLCLPIIGWGQNISEKFPTEEAIKSYLNKGSVSKIEGIYQYNSQGFALMHEGNHRLGLVWDGEKFVFLAIDIVSKHVLFPPKGEVMKIGEDSYSLSWFKSSNAWWPKRGHRYQSIATISNNTIVFSLPVGPSGSSKQEFMHKIYSPSGGSEGGTSGTGGGASSSGTGFAINSSGYIATNSHVINGSKKIEVKGVNGDFKTSYSAVVVVQDQRNDLAILKIDKSLGKIPFGFDNRTLEIANQVYALGYPLTSLLGDDIKFTDGKISSKTGFASDPTYYQHSAPIQPGNSGGPLFNDNGNIIGINTLGVNQDYATTEGVFFSVKIRYLINLMQDENISNPVNTGIQKNSIPTQVSKVKKFIYIIESY